ncbi:hypothetical protein CANINC_004465 [Pichia inconspicua]|uniref:Myb-like domain-containing protein n=1 Tax=Pichia inconspicua TaxID=52247 RepID=A0A4T0WVL6_9ASCO|nr:hypothetical protein CANINC_004465 [[Candida] inconspicua]
MENEEAKNIGKRGRLEEITTSENGPTEIFKKRKTTDEQNIQSKVLHDPICGLHYYRYLFNKLKSALLNGLPQFDNWEYFSKNFILTQEISDEWQTIASKIDMIYVAEEITKIIQEFEKLNTVTSKSDGLNKNYFDLLRKDFVEFFDYGTNYGRSSLDEIEEDAFYVDDDSISLDSSKNALKWTAKEKDIFYESLARYGINRIDEIADLLPDKSQVDIMNLYNILKSELKRYKEDKKLRSKLVSFDELPKAYEVSEEYIKLEEQQASIIESMENENFGEIPTPLSRSNTEYDLIDYDSIEKKFNIKIGDKAARKLDSIVIEYTRELMWHLYKMKLCEMTIPFSYEWYNQLKAWETPPDPRNFVHVINLKDMTTTIDDELDFESIDMSDYEDSENDYFPNFTERELLLKDFDSIENIIEIPEDLDVYGLGITAEEVEEVNNKIMNCRPIENSKLVESEDVVALQSDSESDMSNDDTELNQNAEKSNLLSDVEDINDLKTHSDVFEDLEFNDSHYSQLFYQTNFIVPFDEDYTVCGNEYLQKLCDNETERLEAVDFKDNQLYELLLLASLKQLQETDRNNILDIISSIDDELLHPLQKPTTKIDEKHSKKFMHLYNDY